MTDEEVICEFMEPRPDISCFRWQYAGNRYGQDEMLVSPRGWWEASTEDRIVAPIAPSLDRLRKVQEQLTDEQWCVYHDEILAVRLSQPHNNEHPPWRFFLHASADTKIKALAAVLRPEVEAK